MKSYILAFLEAAFVIGIISYIVATVLGKPAFGTDNSQRQLSVLLVAAVTATPAPGTCGNTCQRVKTYIGQDGSLPVIAPKTVQE